LSYPSAPSHDTPFALDGIRVPDPGPPALARMQAQMMVLNGALDNVVTLPEETPPDDGPAPHPLLDAERGGALRFRLLVDGRPAGPGRRPAAARPLPSPRSPCARRRDEDRGPPGGRAGPEALALRRRPQQVRLPDRQCPARASPGGAIARARLGAPGRRHRRA